MGPITKRLITAIVFIIVENVIFFRLPLFAILQG